MLAFPYRNQFVSGLPHFQSSYQFILLGKQERMAHILPPLHLCGQSWWSPWFLKMTLSRKWREKLQTGRRWLQKGCYLEYKRILKLINSLLLKRTKDSNISHKKVQRRQGRVTKDAPCHITGELQSKMAAKHHYTPVQVVKIQNTDNTNPREALQQQNSQCIAVGNAKWHSRCGSVW